MHLAEYCYAYSWWRLLEWVIDIVVFYALTFVGAIIYYMANPSQLDAADDVGSGIGSSDNDRITETDFAVFLIT